MSASLRIVQLYPDLLGVTGDRGNVEVLATRAGAQGAEITVETFGIGEGDLSGADIVVIGNGPLSALRTVMPDLIARRGALEAHLAAGGVVLAVGAGAEALGTSISAGADRLEGLCLAPFRIERGTTRKVGYVVAEAPEGRIIGFEDHASRWVFDDDSTPWAQVVAGKGGFDAGEGYASRGLLATTIQGPLLPLNPALADALIARAAEHAGITLAPATGLDDVDAYAAGARAKIESLQDKQFTAIAL